MPHRRTRRRGLVERPTRWWRSHRFWLGFVYGVPLSLLVAGGILIAGDTDSVRWPELVLELLCSPVRAVFRGGSDAWLFGSLLVGAPLYAFVRHPTTAIISFVTTLLLVQFAVLSTGLHYLS